MRSYIRSMMLGVAALLVVAPATAAVVSYTNNILTVFTENAGTSAGMFWVKTGSAHPNPIQNVIYDSETSYITLRDVTASEIWTNAGGTPNTNIPGFVSRSMQVAPATAAVTALPTGFRMTYTLPNWVVVQDVVINGTTLADTNVRQSVTVTNTSAVSRSYGVRYMWDWEIAGNDSSVFRTRNPDGTFTNVFAGFNSPAIPGVRGAGHAGQPDVQRVRHRRRRLARSSADAARPRRLRVVERFRERAVGFRDLRFERRQRDGPLLGLRGSAGARPRGVADLRRVHLDQSDLGRGRPRGSGGDAGPDVVAMGALRAGRAGRPAGHAVRAAAPHLAFGRGTVLRRRIKRDGGPRAAVFICRPAGVVSRAASASCRRRRLRIFRGLRCSAP